MIPNIDLEQYGSVSETEPISDISCTAENGKLRLKGRCVDSFNFVDHPWLLVDGTGTQLLEYGCDCPQWKKDRKLCVHCVALARSRKTPITAKNTAAEVPAKTVAQPSCCGEEVPAAGPSLEKLSYKFCNSRYDLYPMDRNPRIPLERYIQVFGNNARARTLYESEEGWGGSCFGFVSSASMLYQQDSGIEVSDFDVIAKIPSQLAMTARSKKLGMTVHSLIEALQIMQYGNAVWSCNPLNDLALGTEAYQKGEGEAVCMAIYSAPRANDGHAILPFRLERTDGPEDILHIYDPNCPMRTRFGYLEKDEAGNYVNWRYTMSNDTTYASKTNGQLYLGFYSVYKQAWDNRGGSVTNLVYMTPGMAILDDRGTLLARMTGKGIETFRDDLQPMRVMDDGAREGMYLSVPAGALRVALEDPEVENLEVQLLGVDLTVDLVTTAREAELSVEDETATVLTRITEPNARYCVKILNTLSQNEVETAVSGITEEELRLVQKDSVLYGSGLTEETQLYVNRVVAPLSSIGQLEEEPEFIANQKADKPEDPQQ